MQTKLPKFQQNSLPYLPSMWWTRAYLDFMVFLIHQVLKRRLKKKHCRDLATPNNAWWNARWNAQEFREERVKVILYSWENRIDEKLAYLGMLRRRAAWAVFDTPASVNFFYCWLEIALWEAVEKAQSWSSSRCGCGWCDRLYRIHSWMLKRKAFLHS